MQESFKAVEQGIFCYLIYYKEILKEYILKFDNFGPIIVLGLFKNKNFDLDSDVNILNNRGEIAALMSQYNKKRDIKKLLIQKFCPELLNSDQKININIF